MRRRHEYQALGSGKEGAGARPAVPRVPGRPASPQSRNRRERRDRARLGSRGGAAVGRASRRRGPTESRSHRPPESSAGGRQAGKAQRESARAIAFHPLAESELLESIAFYEDRAPGLGAALLADVE